MPLTSKKGGLGVRIEGAPGPFCPREVELVPTRVATPWGRAAGTSLEFGTRSHADAGGRSSGEGVPQKGKWALQEARGRQEASDYTRTHGEDSLYLRGGWGAEAGV